MVSVSHAYLAEHNNIEHFLLQASADLAPAEVERLRHAYQFVQTLYQADQGATGEQTLVHACGIALILSGLRADADTRIAGLLFAAADHLPQPEATLTELFGQGIASMVLAVQKLLRLGEVTRIVQETVNPQRGLEGQAETLRKMLLSMAADIRVVLVRLASRLQTMRYFAAVKAQHIADYARETMDLYAPLANRLGVWQIKWELEDLAFRFLEPETYKSIAKQLEEKRTEREAFITQVMARLRQELLQAGVSAEISGRPKHIYSIYNKMRGKQLDFANVYDVRALRVIVQDVKDCYTALGVVHHLWQPLPKEFDDYISRPKANGYRSLHTVVFHENGQAFEVQIRTQEMHKFAEFGVAAHWRYKEAGAAGYAGGSMANDVYDDKIAFLRQLLAWKNEVAGTVVDAQEWAEKLKDAALDDRIYVLTPQARIIELPNRSTPIDFAYHLHTDLGHRCRGARVDGQMVPLNTPLKNGQTVEIIAAKQGSANAGPSRDWLNPQLGFTVSPRARQKVRQWFNAIELEENIQRGRQLLEKELARLGKTSFKLEDLAQRLGYQQVEDVCVALAREEVKARAIELAVLGDTAAPEPSEEMPTRRPTPRVNGGAQGAILVVGVDAVLTQLAKCCRPAPPDEIAGFVTRGRGISIHRRDCETFLRLCTRNPERVIETTWGHNKELVYPVDVLVLASDRQGLLRDISEVFAREKLNVIGVNTQSQKQVARMLFTTEVLDTARLQRAMSLIREVVGVFEVRRK
ncbi:RelA/SpoT family protein [Parvibium lacunae]|uniref:GTP pyrophosphokinase n=1 Tax=Parvibium lacunae TaxID=1888893 RepID=A0A368L7F2_9BURK|nr:bifunctional (p)ppGpp synthetase/guanosine-3',5'-bis(diphosphate) 3'-pyrophosphohydrolase [Parvibium lacunae]RCS59583.1 bifunctional (p)ppGpp synthetase/guanosine-3',5'-bis(diphosphate) 3'-pyrophosphohydrolase [Parvibium lacunae]